MRTLPRFNVTQLAQAQFSQTLGARDCVPQELEKLSTHKPIHRSSLYYLFVCGRLSPPDVVVHEFANWSRPLGSLHLRFIPQMPPVVVHLLFVAPAR